MKSIKYTLGLILLGVLAYYNFKPKSKHKEFEETASTNCTSTEAYKYGYEAGHDQAVMVVSGAGGTSDPDVYISRMNNGYGALGDMNPCWKEGFEAGYREAK